MIRLKKLNPNFKFFQSSRIRDRNKQFIFVFQDCSKDFCDVFNIRLGYWWTPIVQQNDWNQTCPTQRWTHQTKRTSIVQQNDWNQINRTRSTFDWWTNLIGSISNLELEFQKGGKKHILKGMISVIERWEERR